MDTRKGIDYYKADMALKGNREWSTIRKNKDFISSQRKQRRVRRARLSSSCPAFDSGKVFGFRMFSGPMTVDLVDDPLQQLQRM